MKIAPLPSNRASAPCLMYRYIAPNVFLLERMLHYGTCKGKRGFKKHWMKLSMDFEICLNTLVSTFSAVAKQTTAALRCVSGTNMYPYLYGLQIIVPELVLVHVNI